jgi:CheY-like chemotaxis protein
VFTTKVRPDAFKGRGAGRAPHKPCPLVTGGNPFSTLTCWNAQFKFAVSPPFTKGHPLARKILLADDSVTAQNMGRKILTDAGYEVITVNNGSAALKKIAEHKPDLIVLDVYMPGYSGLEVCQRIKENKETSRIPILLTVGKLEPFKPEEARRARADAFVVKPFEASELLTALTKLEDRIVPQAEPYKQGRFAKAMAAVDSDSESGEKFGDSEGGWTARLCFPSGPRKSRDPEPEVDYGATQGKGVCEADLADADKKPKTKAAEPQFERPIPTGLPHDITPEEIAALTAAAAQLSGAPSPVPAIPEESAQPTAGEALTSESPAEESAPVTFASSPSLQEPEPGAAEAPAPPEITQVAPPVETPPAAQVEAVATEVVASEAVPVNAAVAEPEASRSEETSPEQAFPVVDATYEPPQAEAVESTEAQPQIIEPVVEAVAKAEPAMEPAAPEPVSSTPGQPLEIATTGAEPASPEPTPPPPVDDEFMAALQSLMPAQDRTSSPPLTGKEEDMPPALAAIVAEVDSRMVVAHPAGPRWIAEEVALAANEATHSLQKEMEQAYAAFAASEGFRSAPVAAQIAEGAVAIAEPVVEASEAAATTEVSEPPVALAMAAAAADAGVGVAGLQPRSEEVSVACGVEEHNRTEEIHQEVNIADASLEAPAQHDPQAVIEGTGPEMVSGEAALKQSEIVGGTEDMAANWKNIRDSIAGGAAKPAVAKEETRDAEAAHAAGEAFAASTQTTAPPSGAADPRAIANIVESVLAELRPKIVEEIARKLADPKKS